MDQQRIKEQVITECFINSDSDGGDETDSHFVFETSSSEDSDTDSSCEFDKPRRQLHRVTNYLSTIEAYDEEEFKEHFRMRPSTCEYIIAKVEEDKVLPEHKFGREKVSANRAVYMTIWYLSNSNSYREVSDKFDVSKSTAHHIITTVVKYLVSQSPDYICFPHSPAAKHKIKQDFYNLQGINGIIGAIDGTHIKIKRPNTQHYHMYCNRKGDYSILMQAMCDPQKRFLDLFCGEAGSMHDARLLKKSSLYDKGQNGIFGTDFLLGDSAYPCLNWLIPPFRDNGNLSANQRTFNHRHSSSRVIIENAFGLLKGRFRRLRMFENDNITFVVQCCVAAAVLHNICINFDDLIDYEMELIDEVISEDHVGSEITINTTRRDLIMQEMFGHL